VPRGGARPGAGRPKKNADVPTSPSKSQADTKSTTDQKKSSKPHYSKESVIILQKPSFYSSDQKCGIKLEADAVESEAIKWLNEMGSLDQVSPFLIRRYAICEARYLQMEELMSFNDIVEFNLANGINVVSPYAKLKEDYAKDADRALQQIYQVIRDFAKSDSAKEVDPMAAILMGGTPWKRT
jgi:hypothetical protein